MRSRIGQCKYVTWSESLSIWQGAYKHTGESYTTSLPCVCVVEYAGTGRSGLWTKRYVYISTPVLLTTALSSPAHCMSLCQDWTSCRAAEVSGDLCRLRSHNRYTEASSSGSTAIYEYFLIGRDSNSNSKQNNPIWFQKTCYSRKAQNNTLYWFTCHSG